ncbi:membrane alanyl aminopeptidase-like isoform X1 [Ostrinia furnacalis]|uniref:membrane alanyl aminopeptidase-like isoform X1 n=2 Tax=Ostrinia furnacalis TaxID=93504 RepID=UPI00103E582D|nr:membrane alanyl aminopeptidase-like isoform X1 [Ostrinia furnacalis]
MISTMSFLTKLVLVPALLALVSAEFPFELEVDLDFDPAVARNDDPASYRLPEDLDPIHCNIEVTPYFETAPEGKEPFTFDGETTLYIRVLSEGLTAMILQDNVKDIVNVTLVTENFDIVPLNDSTPFDRIRQYFFLRINLADGVTLANGQVYLLNIHYIGNINETPLTRGMFRGNYKDSSGKVHWYAGTHLQPTHGRQLFPSFDEPGFKSTYNITVNRPANFTQTYSNMDIAETIPMGDLVKEVFHTTPRMSAYLISILVSEDFKVIAQNNDADRPYRIIARPNAPNQGEYALKVGPPLTKWFEDYFSIPYYTMGPGMKNDQIASPDWASGATENWGLVSYRELRLLYEEGETNALDKMNIGTITAHELAHKWFGNLITARWWDNVWINEGFASYFEYFGMHGVYPELELESQFNIMYVQSALSADSSAATRALRHTVNSPTEVTGHFSGISYSKGATLLLMLKHFLSEDTFKKALNRFLVDRSYEHAFPEDLYVAFKNATTEDGTQLYSADIEEFLKYWVDEPGYPVLDVTVNTDTGLVQLSQERFFISATATQTQQVWPLPLTYTTGKNPDWNALTPTTVMLGKSDEIQIDAGDAWVIFNVQQKGMYRVNYDENNWKRIANALKADINNIHFLNRAQIVDDVFALMRSQRMTFEKGFEVLDFLRDDTSYYSWYPATSGLNWIRNRFLHLPSVLAEYDAVLFEFLQAVIEDLGYDVVEDEPLTRTLNRLFVLSFACNIGHSGCVQDALQKFTALRTSQTPVNPNLRRHVFCVGLREGTYDDWNWLYNRRLDSNNQGDEVAMLRALGCSSDEQAVKEYLEMILSDDVKAQDTVNAFTFLFMGDKGNAKIALQFLKERTEEIRKAVVLPAWFQNVLSGIAGYLEEEGLEDMEQWLNSNQESVPEFNVGLSAIASARSSMKWGDDNADAVLKAMGRGSGHVIVPTLSLLFTTLIALMLR